MSKLKVYIYVALNIIKELKEMYEILKFQEQLLQWKYVPLDQQIVWVGQRFIMTFFIKNLLKLRSELLVFQCSQSLPLNSGPTCK